MASQSQVNCHKRRLLESIANEKVAASSAQLHDATESAEQVEVQFFQFEREIEQAIAAALKNAADRMGGRQRWMKSRNNEPE
ncbi:hypothetical protein BOX15_Mlig003597g1 [Macrostomum lignano]|uniref:Uncharacterized protein n=1 Tax=Macrostomum lignano TaxID=282301 RepID=A0A267EEA3_9PLAT|nr:hypothetical protein BOX15_Mlig003597g1 [Macrostomum lignano]